MGSLLHRAQTRTAAPCATFLNMREIGPLFAVGTRPTSSLTWLNGEVGLYENQLDQGSISGSRAI